MKDCRGGEYDETENTFDGCILHYYHFADRIGRSGNSRIIPDTDKGDPEKLWSGGIGYPGGIVDSLQLMSRYTKTEYDEICKQAKADPEKLESVSYLTEVNTKLQEKSSYLIFCKNGILVYNGYHGDSSISDEQWEEQLPFLCGG